MEASLLCKDMLIKNVYNNLFLLVNLDVFLLFLALDLPLLVLEVQDCSSLRMIQ